jgi:hypothetical protein
VRSAAGRTRDAIAQPKKTLQMDLVWTSPLEDDRRCGRSSFVRGFAARGGSDRLFRRGICAGWKEAGFRSDNVKCLFAGTSRDGSDGTRTRDLRRDRPVRLNRLQPVTTRNYGYSRHFHAEQTGSDRLRPAAARQSLCGTCAVDVVPTSTTGAPFQIEIAAFAVVRPRGLRPLGTGCPRAGSITGPYAAARRRHVVAPG